MYNVYKHKHVAHENWLMPRNMVMKSMPNYICQYLLCAIIMADNALSKSDVCIWI